MKIQKSKTEVKACSECLSTPCEPCDNKAEAIEFIQSAISALSAYVLENPNDVVATESIANLGVVALDLQGNK
jgi:hypothetical protein